MRAVDRTVLLALIVALFSVLAIAVLLNDVYRDLSAVSTARNQFTALRKKALNDAEDRDYLDVNLQAFSTVMEAVKTGTIQRRAWVEELGAAKIALNLQEMQFDIHPLALIGGDSSDSLIKVGHETIVLKFGVLHEGELLDFFEYISEKVSSPFEIISLDVSRIDSATENGITKPTEINIQAICTIRWYSIGLMGDDNEQA